MIDMAIFDSLNMSIHDAFYFASEGYTLIHRKTGFLFSIDQYGKVSASDGKVRLIIDSFHYYYVSLNKEQMIGWEILHNTPKKELSYRECYAELYRHVINWLLSGQHETRLDDIGKLGVMVTNRCMDELIKHFNHK